MTAQEKLAAAETTNTRLVEKGHRDRARPGRHHHRKHERMTGREMRKLLRRNSLRGTVVRTCGIMPLTDSDAEQHRQRVKTQFFADLEKWEQKPHGVCHFLMSDWQIPALLICAGLIAGLIFGAMPGWIGLSLVFGIGGSLREAINNAADEKVRRQQSAARIRAHAKWKTGMEWTKSYGETSSLLQTHKAPAELQRAVQIIADRHPDAEFKLEVFDEDPILTVRLTHPNIGTEQVILGAWGLPEKFTFH